MARRSFTTLAAPLIARILRVVGRTQSAPNTVTQTYDPRTVRGTTWLKIGGGEDIENGKRSYTADVYSTPFASGTDARIAIGVKARNVYEANNTSATQAGYTIEADPECGDISGIESIPTGSWHESLGVYEIDGDVVHAFKDRNDPIIEGPS